MESLEKQLQKCAPDKVKLIVTDGVFSMEGDVANLPAITALAKKYNASVMVDEAHGNRRVRQRRTWRMRPLRRYRRCRPYHGNLLQVIRLARRLHRHRQGNHQLPAPPFALLHIHSQHHARIHCRSAQGYRHNGKPNLELPGKPLWRNTNLALEGFRSRGFEIGNTSTPIIPCISATTSRLSPSPATYSKKASS